jgi:hypothetical protein
MKDGKEVNPWMNKRDLKSTAGELILKSAEPIKARVLFLQETIIILPAQYVHRISIQSAIMERKKGTIHTIQEI